MGSIVVRSESVPQKNRQVLKDHQQATRNTEMNRSLETSPSLLVRIRDMDDVAAWNQFVDIYAPLIHDYGRKRGLQDADAADLAQEVLQAVAKSVKRFEYDTKRGSFRGWLLTITRNKLIDLVERLRKPQNGRPSIDLPIDQIAALADDEALWERQHQWWLIHWAAEKVRDEFETKTWRAFMMTSVEQATAAEAAKQVGISVGAVYIAKSRVLARVKQLIQEVEGEE